MQKTILFALCLCWAHTALGQNYRAFKKLWQGQDYVKLKLKLDKALAKDSTDAGTLYFLSVFHFDSANRAYYDLGKAYRLAKASIRHKRGISAKQASKLAKAGVDDADFLTVKQEIEQRGFNLAASRHSVEAYQGFIDQYPTAIQLSEAIRIRDAIAYTIALEANTYQAYENFYGNYPESRQAASAYEKYQALVFETKTGGNSIENYDSFIKEHPDSPFRPLAEEKLYHLFVQSAEPEAFKDFLAYYPDSHMAKKAWHWLFYLADDRTEFLATNPDLPDRPYFTKLAKVTDQPLFAFIENGLYGFMDQSGKVAIAPLWANIPQEGRCRSVATPFVRFMENGKLGAADKTGKPIAPADFDHFEVVAPGLLQVAKDGRLGLYHMQGYQLVPPRYTELEHLAHNLIRAKSEGKYGLINYFGTQLTPFAYDDLLLEQGGLIVFVVDGKHAFHRLDALSTKEKNDPALSFAYHDYEASHQMFWKVRQADAYGILDDAGREVVPPLMANIADSPQGWVVQESRRKRIYRLDGSLLSPLHFDEVLSGRKAFGIKTEGKWGVLDFSGNLMVQPLYDTLSFIGELGILLERDGKRMGYFYQESFTDLSAYIDLHVQVVKKENADGLLVEETFIVTEDAKGKKGLMNGGGKVKVPNRYDELYLLTEDLWVAQQRGKRGLINSEGKQALPFAYDGISTHDKGFLSLFKNKQFGTYLPTRDVLIPPAYDALLKTYGAQDSILIAKKGGFGLINLKNEPITDFGFESLRYWTDSVVLVQKAGKWRLFDFKNSYYLPESFDRMKFLRNDADEIVLLTYRSTGYGLLSNKRGRLVPEEYNQIYNMGTDRDPVYVLEKNDRLTNFYLLIYVDGAGEVLKRILLEDEESYERAVCSER